MTPLDFVLCVVDGVLLLVLMIRLYRDNAHFRRRDDETHEGWESPDVSIELDCRVCGQQNRVPSTRLRNRPRCSGCLKTLMPGKRLVICPSNRVDGALHESLHAAGLNAYRFWNCLADHIDDEAERLR